MSVRVEAVWEFPAAEGGWSAGAVCGRLARRTGRAGVCAGSAAGQMWLIEHLSHHLEERGLAGGFLAGGGRPRIRG